MVVIAVLLLGASFTVSALLTGLMRRIAPRLGLIDRPGGHKQHGREVPLGGGVAILATIGLAVGAAALAVHLIGRFDTSWAPDVLREHLPGLVQRMPSAGVLLAGAAALGLMGLIDDLRPLGPAVKLCVQGAVAVAAVWLLGVRAAAFLPAPLSAAVTVVWIVAIVNAINFMDNMDGLAAGVAVVCGAILSVAAAVNGQLFVPAMLLVVVGAAGGFLVHNFPPARIFMGDAGSQALGFFLGVLTVQTTYTRDFASHPTAVFMPLIILAVPLYDLVSVCGVRLAQGRSPARGDRSHFSHRLLARGMGVRSALLTIWLATAATGLAAVFLMRVGPALAWVVFAQTLCVLGMIGLIELHWSKGRSA